MRVGVIGAGHIGGNIARRLALAGHQVTVSFARDRAGLAALAAEVGGTAAEPSGAAAGHSTSAGGQRPGSTPSGCPGPATRSPSTP